MQIVLNMPCRKLSEFAMKSHKTFRQNYWQTYIRIVKCVKSQEGGDKYVTDFQDEHNKYDRCTKEYNKWFELACRKSI